MNALKFQLSPALDFGFHEGALLVSTGLADPVSFERTEAQHHVVALCQALESPKTKQEILHFLQTDLDLPAVDAEHLFDDFYQWNFLIKAHVFDERDLHSRSLLFYGLTNIDPLQVYNTLQSKHVVIIGCGGVGSTLAVQLVTSGVGKITLVDSDKVEASNLTQQIMFTVNDVQKKNKTDALADALRMRATSVQVDTLLTFIDKDTIHQLPPCDLIVVAADSKNIGEDVNDYCYQVNTPFIKISYFAKTASFGPFVIPQYSACHACFMRDYIWEETTPDLVLQQKIDSLREKIILTSLSPVVAIAGSFASLDIIYFLGGFGEILSLNYNLRINTRNLQWTFNPVASKTDCTYCSGTCTVGVSSI